MSDYTAADYVGMLADSARMSAYTRALDRYLRPGSVVVDLGAGPGIFALYAARRGARVHAIEPNDTVLVLPELARASGLADRIVVHHGDSRTTDIGERADLVVADIRGTLPLLGPGLSCIIDARRRLLREGGVLLPERDVIRAAPIGDRTMLDGRARPWRGAAWSQGLELESLARFATSTWTRASVKASQLALPPETLATLDYRTRETESLGGAARWTAREATEASGFAVWFDATIDGDLGYSNAPADLPPEQGVGRADSVYGTAFFPLGETLSLRAGEALELDLRATPSGTDHLWTWRTSVGGRLADEQSSFFSNAVQPASLRRRAETFRPGAGEAALVEREALARFGTGDSLKDIAHRLASTFGARFPSYAMALDYAAALSARLAAREQVET